MYDLYLDIYNGNNYQTYLSPYFINKAYHKESNPSKVFEFVYLKYRDISKLIEDWEQGTRDVIFARIMQLTGADLNPDVESIIRINHPDILQDTLIRILDAAKNYVYTKHTSYYTYLINIFPRIYRSELNRYKQSLESYKDSIVIESEINTEILLEFKRISMEMKV